MPKCSLKWVVQWTEPITLPVLTQRMHGEGLGRSRAPHPLVLPVAGRLDRGAKQRGFVATAVGLLSQLRNSLHAHLPNGEKDRLEHRIRQTIKEFRRLATCLWNNGYRKEAVFLRRSAVAVTTFATLALQGILIAWHNNLLERLMREVSKHCKHKWMSWTSRGGQALLVVRAVEPDTHKGFWRQKLYGRLADCPDLGVRITRPHL